MPSTSKATHPHLPLSITFTEADHRYVDSTGMVYTSASALVKSAFVPFDAPAAAAKVAAREGGTAAEVLATWAKKRDDACAFGTRFHANVEATIRGEPRPHAPRNAREIEAFKLGVETAKKLMARYGANLQPERIVFSPFYGIAGTMDLLAWTGGDYVLLDWKTNDAIKREGYQSCAIHGLEHLPDCNFTHYSLQLSTYERILRREAYIPESATVKRLLIWIGPGATKPEFIETPDLRREVGEILLERAMEYRIMHTPTKESQT